jgi:hypothetical protein
LDERKRGKHANYWDTVRRVDRSDGSRGVLAAATDIQKVLVYCLFTTIFTSLCAASIALMGLEASSLPLLIFRRWLLRLYEGSIKAQEASTLPLLIFRTWLLRLY